MHKLIGRKNRNLKIFSKPVIIALVLFGLLLGGTAIRFSPLFFKPNPPDFVEYKKLRNMLKEEPENQESWEKMLDWLKNEERFLARQKQNYKVNKTVLELKIINNHQQKAIALRRLKRYSKALQELAKAENKLSKLKRKHKCEPGANSSVCKGINTMFSMTFTYFSNVYQSLQDKANAEKYLKLAVKFSKSSERYYTYFSYLITFYAENDDFKQALSTTLTPLEKALTSNNKEEIKELSKIANSLYYKLFTSVSWNLKTYELRDKDPRDFADTHGINIGKTCKNEKILCKYGMTDEREDFATFGTVIVMHEIWQSENYKNLVKKAKEQGYSSVEDLKKNYDMKGYVIEQLSQENFEPAVKYLSLKIRNKFYSLGKQQLKCSGETTSEINIDLVKEKLEEAPIGKMLISTVNAIEVIDIGNTFLNKYCKN